MTASGVCRLARALNCMAAMMMFLSLPPASAANGGCVDSNKRCPEWAADGECYANQGPMIEYCRLSCGMCRPDGGCVDSNTRCSEWAADGECDDNSWMHENCKLSCGTCQLAPATPLYNDQDLKERVNKLEDLINSEVTKRLMAMQSNVATMEDFVWLESELPDGKKIGSLLYQASTHGDAASAFHAHCDGRGATLVVVRATTGYVFGGFADVAWSSSGGSRAPASTSAPFLFALPGGGRTGPRERLDLKEGWEAYAYHHHASFGPLFGRGDIHIADNCRANTESQTDGNDYEAPSAGQYALGGGTDEETEQFQCADYEVWAVIG